MNYETVAAAIDTLISQGMDVTAIIEGASRGVDRLASQYAREHGIENIRMPADWKVFNRGAGPVRNRKMAEMGDALLAFWDGTSSGTQNMIQAAQNRGLPVTVIYVNTELKND